jgi:hypothetical protein
MLLDSAVQQACHSGPFRLVVFIIVVCSSLSIARGQQPFVTDDADVTPRHKFHFEFSNEFDVLQRSAFPNLKQNTADSELDYGLFENVEIGIEAPLLSIVSDRSSALRSATGLGDVNLSLKYNFLKERDGSRRPALAIALNLELPTGDVNRQLGSGLSDFYVNGVVQKSLTTKTKLRLNGGLLFSGNETTGVLGVKARGLVLTGGGSLVRQFTRKLDLGVEVTGALARNLDLGKGQLQFVFGGNYSLNKKMTFDFGIVAGRYAASPRAGMQLGLSVDF